ncbi:MAG: hypothetical protein ACRCZ2_11675 [Fusobacteriaceae bacterium]
MIKKRNSGRNGARPLLGDKPLNKTFSFRLDSEKSEALIKIIEEQGLNLREFIEKLIDKETE